MKVQEKKKAIIFGALAAFLAAYWGFGLLKGGDAVKPGAKKPAEVEVKLPPPETVRVAVDMLARERESYRAARNIFDPVYRKPRLEKPAPVKPQAGGPGGGPGGGPITVTPLPPPPPPKSQAEIDAENAREEMKKAKVMGFLKRKDRTDVFISLAGGNYIVSKGGTIIKEYYLEEIDRDSLTIADRKTGVKVRLSTDLSAKGQGAQPGVALPVPGAGRAPAGPPPAPGAKPGQPSARAGQPAGVVVSGPSAGSAPAPATPGTSQPAPVLLLPGPQPETNTETGTNTDTDTDTGPATGTINEPEPLKSYSN